MKPCSIIRNVVLGLAYFFLNSNVYAENMTLMTLAAGVVDRGEHDWAENYRLEYRRGTVSQVLHPWLSAEYAAGVGSMVLGGVAIDVPVTDHWLVWPSFGAGLYARGGSVRDLGHVIEFRTMLSLNYRMQGGNFFGAYVSHVSNASLSKDNPGANMFGFHYSILM